MMLLLITFEKTLLLLNRLILILLALYPICTYAQSGTWKQEVVYNVNGQLDLVAHTVDGRLSLQYTNHSPDTLQFVWLELWPNAYKNDRTDFSEHMLDIGRNDFYFSDDNKRGYINRLEFRSGEQLLKTEEDPKHIDLVKLYLFKALAPGKTIDIATPFHVKLPFDFAGMGYNADSISLNSWYPKLARYDQQGWHVASFVGQADTTSEAGRHLVSLTLPTNYNITSTDEAVIISEDSLGPRKTVNFKGENATDLRIAVKSKNSSSKIAKPSISLNTRLQIGIHRILEKSWLPIAGFNMYDGFQIGALAQNLADTESNLKYYAATLYAFRSSRITGSGALNYHRQLHKYFSGWNAGLQVASFSTSQASDSTGKKIFTSFYKLAPYISVQLPSRSSQVKQSLEWKTFIIGEQFFDYVFSQRDSIFHAAVGKTHTWYLNQLTFQRNVNRSLYPYDLQLQVQQTTTFYRVNAEAHYLVNYPDGGGMQLRMFAAKFGYFVVSQADRFGTLRYQPKLTAVSGAEDYTYSNYFFGRSEFTGFPSRQVMLRDGGLKLRTDMFQDLQGRSDNWVASANLNTTLPRSIVPPGFPLRIFLDVGTYAQAWKKGTTQPRFLYVSGLQLSLFKNIVNIYAPLFYSTRFRDNLKTIPDQDSFLKKISFSIDIHRLDWRKIY